MRSRALLLSLLALWPRAGGACDSSACQLVTRGQNGLLPRGAFRLDVSYRRTRESVLLEGGREVERVLRPEGRLIVFGLNPASLWGLRQNLGRLKRRGAPYLPRDGEFIGYWRLRDWLKLLSFDVEAARFGVYRPPLRSEAWMQRWQWVEGVGSRWWPVLGAAYFIQAVKRVHGMRLIGLAKNGRMAAKKAPAVALNNHHKK